MRKNEKIIILLLPLLFIMNCEETDETDDGSITGKWTIQSITHYDGASCSENGYERNFTGTIEFEETSADNGLISGLNVYTLSNNSSFERFCEVYDGSVVNDTSCSALYFGDPFEFGVSYYSMICDLDSANVFDEDTYNCDFNWSEIYAYSYDMETAEFCQQFLDNSSLSELHMESLSLVAGGLEPFCGTLSVTGNNATIQLIDENDGSSECVEILLSK